MVNETNALKGENFDELDTQAANGVFVNNKNLSPNKPEMFLDVSKSYDIIKSNDRIDSGKQLDEKNIFVDKLLEEQDCVLEQNNVEKRQASEEVETNNHSSVQKNEKNP